MQRGRETQQRREELNMLTSNLRATRCCPTSSPTACDVGCAESLVHHSARSATFDKETGSIFWSHVTSSLFTLLSTCIDCVSLSCNKTTSNGEQKAQANARAKDYSNSKCVHKSTDKQKTWNNVSYSEMIWNQSSSTLLSFLFVSHQK